MASKKKNQKNFTIDEINALDDFYFNFQLEKIVTNTDPDFSIDFHTDDGNPDDSEPFRFLVKLGDFNISFYVTKLYDDKIRKIMDESYAENGIMTMPICAIGYKTYVEEAFFIDGRLRGKRKTYPENKFDSLEQQNAILALFKRAMLAFPSTLKSEIVLSSRLMDYQQTEKFEEHVEIAVAAEFVIPPELVKPAYGVQIEYSPELLTQIANGELIR